MKKKILVIDDEELIIRTLTRALEKKGYELLVAKGGEDALAVVEEESLDLVISDIRMPGENGVQVVKKILEFLRSKSQTSPKIIFITGYADRNVEREALALNPVAYIMKPFDFQEFMQKVEEALGEKLKV